MSRSFERTTIKHPGSPNQPGYQIICSKCNKIGKVTANNHSGSMPPEALAAKFRNAGWIVGPYPGKDVCPECQEKAKKPKSAENNVVTMTPPTIVADAPRAMSKDDGRVIFAKISDVYLDETKGYSAGWSDKRVAEDLGVPLAWVKSVREEWFGKEGSNEELTLAINRGRDMISQMEATSKALTSRAEALMQAADELRAHIEKVSKIFK